MPDDRWWQPCVQAAVAMTILGGYFTLIGSVTMAFVSYDVGLLASGWAALLVWRGKLGTPPA